MMGKAQEGNNLNIISLWEVCSMAPINVICCYCAIISVLLGLLALNTHYIWLHVVLALNSSLFPFSHAMRIALAGKVHFLFTTNSKLDSH